MSIIQSIIGTNLTISAGGGGGGGGGGVTPDGTFFWEGSPLTWGSAGIDPNKPTYNATYNFPDGVTTGQAWGFNGNDNTMTTTASSGFTQVYMNIWFYPYANGRVLMTIQNTLAEQQAYHHTALEINANDTVSGSFWANGYITTANTVTLNAWNHIYFRHNGTQALLQLNGGTAVTQTSTWSYPTPLVVGFGTTSITNNGYSARYNGMLADFYLNSSNTASNYEDTRSKYEVPPTAADFTVEWWQKVENNSNNPRPWSVGLYPTQKIAVSYENGSSDYYWINDSWIGYAPSNHIGQGWQHMAFVRHNGVITGYENGSSYITINNNNSNVPITATDIPLYVGTGELAAGTYKGYIKDLHIIKGTAKYTTNFLVPTGPVQSQSGSVFLLSATNDGTKYVDSVGGKSSSLTGTVNWSSDCPFAALGPYTQFSNTWGSGPNIDFSGGNYNADLLNVKAGWVVSDGSGFRGYVTTNAADLGGVIRINVDFAPGGSNTWTFTQPEIGGSLYFDGSSYLNYGASTDWAMDV